MQQVWKKNLCQSVQTGLKLAVITYRVINVSSMMQCFTTSQINQIITHGILCHQTTAFNNTRWFNEVSYYQYCLVSFLSNHPAAIVVVI